MAFVKALNLVETLIHDNQDSLSPKLRNNKMAFLTSTALDLNRLQGIISITEDDNYLKIQRLVLPLFDEYDDEYLDFITEEELKTLEECIYNFSSTVRQSYDRQNDLNSDFAGFEEAYEGGRVDAGLRFLKGLVGVSDDITRYVSYTTDHIEW